MTNQKQKNSKQKIINRLKNIINLQYSKMFF